MKTIKMRIPTSKEWDKMMAVCNGDNKNTHWEHMYTWVNDTYSYPDPDPKSSLQAYRGSYSFHYWSVHNTAHQSCFLGFRPAFEGLNSDAHDGDLVVVGTLYMDGNPVKVPADPTFNGDITIYIKGSKLEIREPLEDPAYQVAAIKVGDMFITDRVLVSGISYDQIVQALS